MNQASPGSGPVFLCYARKDEEFVLSMYSQLRTRGVDVWLDQADILKGTDWDRSIDEALNRCACLVIFLSPDSVASEEVRAELRTAFDLRKPIVPVLLRKCDIPRRLKLREFVDLSSTLAGVTDGADQVFNAISDAVDGRVEGRVSSGRRPEHVQTLLRRWQVWVNQRTHYVVAVTYPPLAFATAQLVRLPVEAEHQNVIAFASAAVCLFALWIGNRALGVLCAAGVGAALVLKPLIVPIEGFVGGEAFPYDSEVAMSYWVPGALLLVLAAVIAAVSTMPRLTHDFRRLRPNVMGLALTSVIAATAWWHYSHPTVYDVYLPFRPQYQLLRERLKSVADEIDRVKEPFAPRQRPEPPLVIDRRSGSIRSEHPSTTGHVLLYQHLREPEKYFGDIEYAFKDNLHLNLRDTGPDPVLFSPRFADFASDISMDRNNLQRVAEAPYVVVVKPLRLDSSARVDAADVTRAGPYRIVLYNLKRNEIVFATDVGHAVTSFDELSGAMNDLLKTTAGAEIVQ